MRAEHYRAVVIGSGQGGGPLANAFASAGHKTALIEREHVGGTCVNEGCTPTKTMVASARVAALARRGASYGVNTGEISVDLKRVRERKNAMVTMYRESGERRATSNPNETLIMGEASFEDANTILVRLNEGGEKRIQADQIFINTGTRTATPDVPGLADLPYLTSTSIMELTEVPRHLIIIGGGYIGLEFGQMFHRFGSAVTIIQRGKQLLANEDPDIAEEVLKILQEDGLDILLQASVVEASGSEGDVRLSVRTAQGLEEVRGSHILFAVGRVPNTDVLNLDAAGVKVDAKGYIVANERLETSAENIFVVGDVKGGPAFTHISYDDFRILRANLLEGGKQTTRNQMVPYTVFIDPQLGRVGLTEREAREQGLDFKIARMPMTYVARALESDESRGVMKALVDRKTDQILGCAILGFEGGEIMSAIQIAMMGKLTSSTLKDGIFAHPTLMESLNNLFSRFEEEAK